MYSKFNLEKCQYCPRRCNSNRLEYKSGFCKIDNGIYISSIVIHKGEEPSISGDKGICNVFFAHCNLQCVYCQNFQISDNNSDIIKYKKSLEQTVEEIVAILKTGIPSLGFVSPSHFIPQTVQIIESLHKRGFYPTIVYNTNGYESLESLKKLENFVDIYLPDFKYSDDGLALKYSNAPDYFKTAYIAIKEMFRQKGDLLYINKNGYAESGLIIRHLVLPNQIENSIKILRTIANEISNKIHISLMSQYYPTYKSLNFEEINRHIYPEEYESVVNEMKKLGLNNGWIQEYESKDTYRPDFEKETPFE